MGGYQQAANALLAFEPVDMEAMKLMSLPDLPPAHRVRKALENFFKNVYKQNREG